MAMHCRSWFWLVCMLMVALGAPLGAEETRRNSGTTQRRASPTVSRTLLLPRRPVRIIPIEGTDLLLIVGQGGGKGSLPMPVGPVTVDAIEELDLLIIRSGRRPWSY